MDIVLLGGASAKNQHWLDVWSDELSSYGDTIYAHPYRHWESEDISPDEHLELSALEKHLEGIETYIIMAKSFGTRIAFQGIVSGMLTPEKCIFMGVPEPLEDTCQNVGLWVEKAIPTLFVQQESDKYHPAEELKRELRKTTHQNYTLQTIPGGDHTYWDVSEIKSFVIDFVSL